MSQPTARQDLAVRPAGLDAGLAALFGADPADVPSAAKLLVSALRELSEAAIVIAGRGDDDSWQVIGGAAADGDLGAIIAGAGGGYPIVRVCEPVAVLAGTGDPALARAVEAGGQWLALIASRAAAREAAAQEAAETAVLRTVIEQLLCVRDLDQLLLSIADRTLNLLDADICGVLLREGDELRMRSCVGNRLVETSRLRMERGQGVAGLVFLTGEPAKVDNYLDDTTISQDFMT